MLKIAAFVPFLAALALLFLAGCGQSPSTSTTASPAPLKISTTSLPDGRTGLSYSQTLQAVGGKSPYVWSITSGNLPDGVLFSANNGIISGLPRAAGTFAISVEVRDSLGAIAEQNISIVIQAASQPLTSNTSSLMDGEVGVAYSRPLKARGGDGKYTWSLANGTLPDGLSLDPQSGLISGKPTIAGKSFITAKVTDGSGAAATEALTLNISNPVNITTPDIPEGEVGIVYSQVLQAADGVPNYLWTVIKGSLPDGLTMDQSNAFFYGTPTKGGIFPFTLQLDDAAGGRTTLDTKIQIFDHIVLTTTVMDPGTVGVAYSKTLDYQGGNGTVVWAFADGALPDGLSFEPNDGIVSGTPTKAGTFSFSIQVIDSLGADSTQSITLQIQ